MRALMFVAMFCVSETEAAAIRDAYERGGELSGAIKLRRLFPGLPQDWGCKGQTGIFVSDL